MQVAGFRCRMGVAGPPFLTNFSVDIAHGKIFSGKTLIDRFIVIFRCLDFSFAKFYIS